MHNVTEGMSEAAVIVHVYQIRNQLLCAANELMAAADFLKNITHAAHDKDKETFTAYEWRFRTHAQQYLDFLNELPRKELVIETYIEMEKLLEEGEKLCAT